jgi:leucyl aminopeptidase (aminopeptidase T)
MRDDYEEESWTRISSLILRRSLRLRRGQSVVIDTGTNAVRLAEILANEARRLGIRPVILCFPDRTLAPPDGMSSSIANAISPPELALIAASSGYIRIPPGLEILKLRMELPPAQARAFARRSLEWHQALVRHSVPSVYFLGASATKTDARLLHVDFSKWSRESLRSSAVDPRALGKEAKPMARRLQRGRRVTIRHPNGTHLELGLLGRSPILDDGMVDPQDLASGRNWTTVPSGSLLVALDERTAEGRLVANRPSRHLRGVVRGLTWTFHSGRLTHYDVGSGRRIFEESYREAGRERDRPAILSIGLNPEIRDFPLAEDSERGVVCMYIGHNDDVGGRTHGSYRDYALVEGADLLLDDKPLLRAGHRR